MNSDRAVLLACLLASAAIVGLALFGLVELAEAIL